MSSQVRFQPNNLENCDQRNLLRSCVLGIRVWSKRRTGGVRQGLLLHRLDQPDHQCEQLLVTCSLEHKAHLR